MLIYTVAYVTGYVVTASCWLWDARGGRYDRVMHTLLVLAVAAAWPLIAAVWLGTLWTRPLARKLP